VAAALALVVYAVLLAGAAVVVWRRPTLALYAFIVGLAAHNAVMASLYAGGVRGSALTAIQAWKEILLAVAVVRVLRDSARARRLPFRPRAADWLALAFGALVFVYALIPQSVLGGLADRKAVLYGLRHDVVPVVAFLLFRALGLDRVERRRLAWTVLGTAAAVAAIGLVDVYAIPIGWWRENGVADYFRKQLGYDYHGTGGLPENFIYNTGSEAHFLRRLVSVFLSPLAVAYLMVVALLLAPRRALAVPLAAVAFAGLLFTFSRSSLIALAGGLVIVAIARRSFVPVAVAVAVVAIGIGWASVFPKIGPTGHWTKADLAYQHQVAKQKGPASGSALSENEPSIRSHLANLKQGIRTVVHHPLGFGLGNVGQTASRTGTPLKAGESNYTEIGAETGLLGAALWLAWGLAVLGGLLAAARSGGSATVAGMAGAFAAVLALAVQTDVIGDPWVAYCVWGLAGGMLAPLATVPE
jgi:hypothetical protein